MKKCSKKACLFYYVTVLANIALIIAFLSMFAEARGSDRFYIFLYILPPLFSLLVFFARPDKEERDLNKRIKKAKLRKEIHELKDFDKAE